MPVGAAPVTEPAGLPASADPIAAAAGEGARRARRREASAVSGDEPQRALAVLLVEDSPVLVERLREALGAMPEIGALHTVDRESAAVDALGPWDVLVLDLHLKQGTGFGVLRELRRRPELTPVVVVFTNHDVPGYRRRAGALGVEHFLDKARDFDRLGELLREIHAGRGARARA